MRTVVAALAVVSVAAVVALLAAAAPGRVSVGLGPGASPEAVGAAAVAATGGRLEPGLDPLRALVLSVPDVDAGVVALRPLPGVAYAEPVTASRSILWTPNDPLSHASDQWYLPAVRAFDYWAAAAVQPPLPPVRVAVVDSGIDAGHPELEGRIAAARSFVSSPATTDSFGHGTAVAGEIAAATDNGRGIAGLGLPVELLVAKVVRADGSISVEAEARAIRWAVGRGAQVINLSLGGPRDPTRPAHDTYSELERSAVDYATRHGVVVVAAAGNCAYRCPDEYADYPAALPHVVGVAATDRADATPLFSNRDASHDDLAAPGVGILSTYPRALTFEFCPAYGYTRCARAADEQNPKGTSFSAPLVSATAALVIAQASPFRLAAGQVSWLLERSATDIGPRGHDSLSGWGLLDVDRAVRRAASAPPPRDRLEPNDDTREHAATLRGVARTVRAGVAQYEDPRDVYRLYLRARHLVRIVVSPARGLETAVRLLRPGTPTVSAGRRWLAAVTRVRRVDRITVRARSGGWYFLEVRRLRGNGAYRLEIAKR